MMHLRNILAAFSLALCGTALAVEIQDMTELAAAPASGDLLVIVDVSDTTDDAAGTGKRITTANLAGYMYGTAGTFTAAQTAQITDAGTTTVVYPLIVDHQSSGTPAAGQGVGIAFNTETAAGNTETGGYISLISTDVTAASEDFDLAFYVMDAGAAPTMRFRIDSDGVYWFGANRTIDTASGFDFKYFGTSMLAIGNGVVTFGSSVTAVGYIDRVEAVTTTKAPLNTESNEAYTNSGDTDGASWTLPNDPAAGICYRFGNTAGQTMTIAPSAGESLFMGADQCNTSMTASGDGATVQICADVGGSGGQWNSYGASGWTCND